MTAEDERARDEVDLSITVDAWESVESLFVSAILDVLCECRGEFGERAAGMLPVMHISRKGGIPGTSSSLSLMLEAIWKRDEDSVGILLDAMVAGMGAPLILIALVYGYLGLCYRRKRTSIS